MLCTSDLHSLVPTDLNCSQVNLFLSIFRHINLEKSCGQQFYHVTFFCNDRKNYLKISGPGCSSLGGAMLEIGPFFVNRDNKTLSRNKYAWNNGKLIQQGYIWQLNYYTSVLTDHCGWQWQTCSSLRALLVLASHTRIEHQITITLVTGTPQKMHIFSHQLAWQVPRVQGPQLLYNWWKLWWPLHTTAC